jgi:3-oxoacyl-[acyl-carrier-protein] synthase II
MPSSRRAVITGLSTISPIGTGKDAFYQGLRSLKSGITTITRFDASPFAARHAGQVEDFDPAKFFPSHRLKRLDRYAQFSVASAHMAIADAALPWSPDQLQDRVGVSFGTALGGIANAEQECANFLERGHKAVSRALALNVFGGSAHSNIAIEFKFGGPGTTNSNSCASANVALGDALNFIRDGRADVVIAGAAEAPLSPLTFAAFDNIHTMSRWQGQPPGFSCRPFDSARSGFVMGEGAACFVVEELSHALARGAHIYAELASFSLNNEAYHMTSPRPDGRQLKQVIQIALDAAGVTPAQLDLVSCHASSTQLNDANEAECLLEIFADQARHIAISATKGYTAHALGATGAFELATCLLAMEHSWIPPILHLEDPDPATSGLDLVTGTGRDAPVTCALSNAFGFGGINSCVVLRRLKDGDTIPAGR